jgi:hypothetical protein
MTALGDHSVKGAVEAAGRGDTNPENDTCEKLFPNTRFRVYPQWNLLANPLQTDQTLGEILRTYQDQPLNGRTFTWNEDLCYSEIAEEGSMPAGKGLWVWSEYDGYSQAVRGTPPLTPIHLSPGWHAVVPSSTGMWPDAASVSLPIWLWDAQNQRMTPIMEAPDGLTPGQTYWLHVSSPSGFEWQR